MTDSNSTKQQDSDSPLKNDASTRVFPPYLLWFVVIPALPFLCGIFALQFFINPTPESIDFFIKYLMARNIGFIDQPVKTLTHLTDLFTYLSISSFHVVICVSVIAFYLYQIHQLPNILIKRSYLYFIITAVTFLTLACIVHVFANDLVLTQLGYKSICVLLSKADLQTALVGLGHTGEACFKPEFTRLVWLAYVPIIFGVLAMISAGVFTTVMASEALPVDVEQWREQFLARVKLMQKSFYLLSLVLVTSTVTILLFSSLPLGLLTDAELIKVLKKFINGIAAFWGAMFTATLFATFAPAVVLFVRHTQKHKKGVTTSSTLVQWLYEFVFVSIKKQVMNAIMIISPMLIGPLGNLMQNLSGLN